MRARLWTDGGARGNPGPAASAFVLEGDDGTVLDARGEAIGVATNNVAEYRALVAGLAQAAEMGVDEVAVVSDSELLVKQMRGEYKVKNADLRPLFERAQELADGFRGGVTYVHVRRELNNRADQLGNDALDGKRRRDEEVDEEPGVSMTDEIIACLELAGLESNAKATWRRITEILTRHGVELPQE